MAGVATKKPGSDVGLQATFPSVFEAVEASRQKRGIAVRGYAPTIAQIHGPMPESGDIQGVYHRQKCEDAHRMAMAKVHSTRMMNERSNVSRAGYWKMPKAVLGQRIFANPALGAAGIGGDIYSARNALSGGGSCYETQLRGGVLRTIEGQTWGRNKLRERVNQLNAIASAKSEFINPQMSYAPEDVEVGDTRGEPFGESTKVEFNTIRQSVIDSVADGRPDSLALKDLSRLLSLLFRYAPGADKVEMEDIISGFETMLETLDDYIDLLEANPDRADEVTKAFRTLTSMREFTARALDYSRRMYSPRLLYAGPRARVAASRGFVKSLGFSKLVRTEGSQKYEAKPLEGPLPRGPQPPLYRDIDEPEAAAVERAEDAAFGREGPRLAAQDEEPEEDLLLPAFDLGGPAYAAAAAAAAEPVEGPAARGGPGGPGLIRFAKALGGPIELPLQLPGGAGPAPQTKPQVKMYTRWALDDEPFTRGAAEQSAGEQGLRVVAAWAGVPIGRKGPKAIRTTILRKLFGNAS